jgi:hypothetical protein
LEAAVIDKSPLTRRRFLNSAGILGGMLATFPAWADGLANLNLPGGPDERSLTTSFPQKGTMILQRSRPPLLETPFEGRIAQLSVGHAAAASIQ